MDDKAFAHDECCEHVRKGEIVYRVENNDGNTSVILEDGEWCKCTDEEAAMERGLNVELHIMTSSRCCYATI